MSEQYQDFLTKFRATLDVVMARVAPSSANAGLHARILRRLGDSLQALADLAPALKQDPGNPALLLEYGLTQFDAKNYPVAAESALQAWERSGRADKTAWTLYQMSKGRVAPGEPQSSRLAATNALPKTPGNLSVHNDNSNLPTNLPIRIRGADNITVPAVSTEDPPGLHPKTSHLPLLPIGTTGLGLFLTGYGIYRGARKSKEETEDALPPDAVRKPGSFSAPLGTAADYALRAKIAIEDHPYVAGGISISALALGGWLVAGPSVLGGSGLVFATTAGTATPISAPAAAGVAIDGLITTGLIGSGAVLVAKNASNQRALAQSDNSAQTRTGSTKQQTNSRLRRPGPVKDQKLQNIIDSLFRPADKTPGGTAGAVRNEILTGQQTGSRWHLTKAQDSIRRLDKVLRQPNLNPVDRATAEALQDDLLNALNTNPPVIP